MASRTLSLITDLQRPECLCKLPYKLSRIGGHSYRPARDVAFVSDVYSMLRETPVRRRCCVVAATFLLKRGIPEVLVTAIIIEAFLNERVHYMACSRVFYLNYHNALLSTGPFGFHNYVSYVPYVVIPEKQTEISGDSIEEMIRVQRELDRRDTRRRRDQLRRLRRLRQSHWK